MRGVTCQKDMGGTHHEIFERFGKLAYQLVAALAIQDGTNAARHRRTVVYENAGRSHL